MPTSFRNNAFWVLCCTIGLVVILSDSVIAAEINTLDSIVSVFETGAKQWAIYFQDRAKWLFWSLAGISFSVKMFPKVASGFKGDFGDLIGDLVQFLIGTGFFYFLLTIACRSGTGEYDLVHMIISGFQQMGTEASSRVSAESLTPSGVATTGLHLVSAALRSASGWSAIKSTGLVVSSLLTAVVFIFIAAKMCVVLISAWVTAYAGIFYLGFGGASFTKDIAVNFLKGCLAMAVKVMVFCLIIGVGQSILLEACAKVASPKVVKIGSMAGLGVEAVTTNTIVQDDVLVILSIALLLYILASEVPDVIAGLISGSHVGGMGSAVTMGAAMHVAHQASGAVAGSVGNAVAGASAAANIARQTAAQSQAGEGIFSGSRGAGESSILGSFAKAKGTDGMSGLAGYGARFGVGYMKNLATGVGGAMQMKGARTTMGTLDAGVKLNTAREANARSIASAGGTGPTVRTINDKDIDSTAGKITAAQADTAVTIQSKSSVANSVQSAWSGSYEEGGSMFQAVQEAWQSGNMFKSSASPQHSKESEILSDSAAERLKGDAGKKDSGK